MTTFKLSRRKASNPQRGRAELRLGLLARKNHADRGKSSDRNTSVCQEQKGCGRDPERVRRTHAASPERQTSG